MIKLRANECWVARGSASLAPAFCRRGLCDASGVMEAPISAHLLESSFRQKAETSGAQPRATRSDAAAARFAGDRRFIAHAFENQIHVR
jgi:hypothetical protein